MNELCMIIKDMVEPNFLNIKTSIQTYDRNALCCGVPCWRWVYHALHSADKWFINPFDYEEPPFHEDGMDDPDKPCRIVLSDEQLLVLRQFRYISFHTGMLNGQTAISTGEFPMWVSETGKYVDDGKFFGRYRKGKIKL